jgi:hypothetical protein
MIELRFVIREAGKDIPVLELPDAAIVPNVGETLDIGATIYSVAARHFLYADDKSGRVFVTCWLANVDGMMGTLLRASR